MTILAIILAAVANMLIGMIWYHPKVFGRMWQRIMGDDMKKVEAMQASKKPYILSGLGSLVTAFGIYLIMSLIGIKSLFGVIFAVSLGYLAFGAMPMLMSYTFEARRLSLWLIFFFYQVVSLKIMGAIIYYMI